MTSVSFSDTLPLPSRYLIELANSGALNEISNSPGAVRQHIQRDGLVKDGITRKAIFFAIYQTGRYGPQNGFRICLIHQGFKINVEDEAIAIAEAQITQGLSEFITLGAAPAPIQDP
ncbi:hypothetical protein B0O99DRAFT_616735 [Bisporella sp. PMI_857]|nr:hypothetical protein B0O99DRAFT_616735 [Bisporella sp. PMI_857]